MPQNTVKGMRLHRYVAHFPAHFDVAGAAAVGKAFNKARVYPRAPVQPSPPPARSAVVPSAAAIAKCGRVAAARAVYGCSIGGGHGCNGGRRRARPRPTAHRRGQGQGGLLAAHRRREICGEARVQRVGVGRGARAGGDDAAVGDAALKQREAARFPATSKRSGTPRWSRSRRPRRRRRRRRWRRRRRRRPRRRPRRTRRRARRQRRATRRGRRAHRRRGTTAARATAPSDELLRLGGDDGAAYRRQLRETIELRGEVTLGKLAAARARQLAQLAVGGVSGAAAADGVERAAAARPASLRVLSDIADSCPELRLIAGEGGTNYEATTLVDLAQSTAPPPPPPRSRRRQRRRRRRGSPDASLAERRRKEEGYRRGKSSPRAPTSGSARSTKRRRTPPHHERQRLEKERESRAEREQRKAAERADREQRKADERSFNLRPGITGPVSMRPGDWICPNPACEVVVYGTRSICFKCKTPKPGGAREKIVSKKEAAKLEAKEVMASVAARLGGGYAAARPKAVAKQEAAAKQEAEAAAKFAEQQTSWYLADGSLDHVRLLTSPSQTPTTRRSRRGGAGNTRELPHGSSSRSPPRPTISDLKTKLDGAWPDQPTTKALKLITQATTAFWSGASRRAGDDAVVIDAEEARRSRSGAPSRRDVAMPAAAPPTATPAAVAAGGGARLLVRPEVAASLAATAPWPEAASFATPPTPPPPPPAAAGDDGGGAPPGATADVAAAMRVANHRTPRRRGGRWHCDDDRDDALGRRARVNGCCSSATPSSPAANSCRARRSRATAAMGVRLNDAARAWDTQASPPPPPGQWRPRRRRRPAAPRRHRGASGGGEADRRGRRRRSRASSARWTASQS